jgi:hypothetical protein
MKACRAHFPLQPQDQKRREDPFTMSLPRLSNFSQDISELIVEPFSILYFRAYEEEVI